jgi:hypothetical protein
MMKRIAMVIAVAVVCGCHATPPAVHHTEQTLTGVVIRKDWSKSLESWSAGGSEYYVLKVEESALHPGTQTADEGVILRPSRAVPFGDFTNFIGRRVTCRGQFVAGERYIPPKDSVEQMPGPSVNPITGEAEYPVVGAGFKVHAIEPIEKK